MDKMTQLSALKRIFLETQNAYMAHPSPSEKTTIEHDLLGASLLKQFIKAKTEYEDALKSVSATAA